MNKRTIRLKEVRVKDLYDFARDYAAAKDPEDLEVISLHRAHSQANNPHADESDVGLLVAYEGDKCVGYLGLMPGLAEIGDNCEKVYWATGWYVSPKVRGQSVGSLLMKKALLFNKVIILTGMSRDSEWACKHLGFQSMEALKYTEIDLRKWDLFGWLIRIVHKLMERSGRGTNFIRKAFEAYDRFLYSRVKKIQYRLLERKTASGLEEMKYEEVKFFEAPGTEMKSDEKLRFCRGPEVINWMLTHPWVKGRDKSVGDQTDYYFSNVRDAFRYVAFTIHTKDGKDKVAFSVLSITTEQGKTKVKLLDHEGIRQTERRAILALTVKVAESVAADCLEISEDTAACMNIGILECFMLRRKERRYVYSVSDEVRETTRWIKAMHRDYCDGDTAFT